MKKVAEAIGTTPCFGIWTAPPFWGGGLSTAFFTQKDALTVAGERGRAPGTYIRGWAFVGTWAGEGDEFMAPLVHDETADCKREKKGRKLGGVQRQVGKRGKGGERSLNLDFTTRKVLQQNEQWLQLPHLALCGNHSAVASYKSVQLLKVTRVQKITNAQNSTPSPKIPSAVRSCAGFETGCGFLDRHEIVVGLGLGPECTRSAYI